MRVSGLIDNLAPYQTYFYAILIGPSYLRYPSLYHSDGNYDILLVKCVISKINRT